MELNTLILGSWKKMDTSIASTFAELCFLLFFFLKIGKILKCGFEKIANLEKTNSLKKNLEGPVKQMTFEV